MANRKKPTNQELLNMCLFLRERLDYTTKLCEDTAFVLKTFLDMEGKEWKPKNSKLSFEERLKRARDPIKIRANKKKK